VLVFEIEASSMKSGISPASLEWKNGAPYSKTYGDIYFSQDNGLAESEFVFIEQNKLTEVFAQRKSFVICELGFGTGLNFLLNWLRWLETADPDARLFYIGFEKHPLTAEELAQAMLACPELNSLSSELIEKYPPLTKGFHNIQLENGRVNLTLVFGDAKEFLPELIAQVDHFNLDGFAPAKNPELWSKEIFSAMANISRQGTTFSTFTAAGFVKRGLEEVGFDVTKCPGFGKKRESLKGVFAKGDRKSRHRVALPERVAIIGGGLSGTAAAYALSKRGLHVTLLEKEERIAPGASGNPSAIVMPYLQALDDRRSRFYLSAFSFFLQHITELYKHVPDLDWRQTGVLHLPAQNRVTRLMSVLSELKLPQDLVVELDAKQATEMSGIEVDSASLFYKLAGIISPERLCAAYLKACKDLMHLRLNSKALDIEKVAHGYRIMDASGNILVEANIVVIANAYDCRSFKELGWLKVEAVKGQLCKLGYSTEELKNLRMPVCANGHVTPGNDSYHYLGATYHHGDPSDSPDPAKSEALFEKFSDWLPAFKSAKLVEGSERVSYRTSSYDRIPYIGQVPDYSKVQQSYNDRNFSPQSEDLYFPGLYLTTGHGSRGTLSCPFAAEILATQVCNEPLPLERELVETISPLRYLLKQLRQSE